MEETLTLRFRVGLILAGTAVLLFSWMIYLNTMRYRGYVYGSDDITLWSDLVFPTFLGMLIATGMFSVGIHLMAVPRRETKIIYMQQPPSQ